MTQAARPAWDVVRLAALLPENLPRVIAGLGFDRVLAEFQRGQLAWWQPDYHAGATKHLHIGRETMAEMNRAMRDSRVLVLLRHVPELAIWIDLDMGHGCWRNLSGSQRGDCVITLAMLMLEEPRFGRAASRVARLCGIGRIPDLPPPVGVTEYVAARLARSASVA